MKKKFISLLLAFLMLVTTLPVPALAQEVGPASEELEKLDYEFERIDGQDYLKVTLPANSVEVVEDPYVIRPMSIKDNVPTQGGAGHFINWGTGVVWNVYDKNDPNKLAPFPPTGKKPYEVKLTKELNGKNVVIGKVTVSTATEFEDDIKPDKPTTYQFVTTENYEVGDENKELSAEFPIELEMNLLYEVAQTSAKGPIGNNHEYNLIFLIVTRLTSPTYTAEWDTTTGALKPTVKGKIVTGKNNKAIIDVFNDDGKYGTICNKPAKTYIDEEDKDGNLIGEIRYTKKGSLDIKSVLWTKGSIPVMSGQFLSYSTKNIDEDGNVTTIDHNINGTKGLIPAHYATMNDGAGKKYTPPYFYNLVGDNDHMWRFQLKEGLEVKFNTGVGSETEGGLAGQDIGQASTIAYGETFDANLKGAFSDKNISLPTSDPLPPTLSGNTAEIKFLGWKLVEGQDKPVNPQKITTDASGNQTLTEVKPDYETTDKINLALNNGKMSFTKKNPTFFAIFGIEKKVGKASIVYLDDKGATIDDKFKFSGQDYKTEKTGNYNTAVTATTDEAPKFIGYAIKEVKIEPETDAQYADPATAKIKFVYNKLADVIPSKDPQDQTKENKKPDGYVTVRFLTNQNGTLVGETTYYVNPKANKTMNDITAPTITPKDGYKISTETAKQWEPNLDKTKVITEDLFYVANYESVSKVEIAYVSMDTDMGTVDPGKEEVKAGKALTGSTATAKPDYEFVGWVKPDGTKVTDGVTGTKLVPTSRDAAIYIAKFKKTDETLGKIKVQYLDENFTVINEDKRIGGGEYLTDREGKLGSTVDQNEFIQIAPKFEGYVLDKFAYSPKTSKYTADGRNTVKYYYYKRVTTEDKSNNSRYFKVVFDANDGEFNAEPKNQKDVYVYSNAKAIENNVQISFKEVREEVEKVYGKPVKTGENFIDWKDMETGGTKVEDTKIIVKPSGNTPETFYAAYAKASAYVSYRDLDGNIINTTKFKVDGQEYPTEKEGTADEAIAKDVYTAETAPKLIGYKFNRIELNPANAKYAINNKATIKIYYEKLDDVIPSTGNDKPDGYVTVEFLADDDTHTGNDARGTLTGETKFYVNPKAEKKNSDLTEPTIKAKTGFTVASPKWKPDFVSVTAITADATYTAQYTDGKDVIPVPDPSNPPDKPENYVTVKFDLDGKGTTTDTKEFYVNPNKEVEITAPTVTGIGNYKQKTDDDAWSPKFVTKAKYDKDKTFVAQYTFDKDVVPQGPGEDKPVVPDNYKKVEFKEGEHGVISASQTTIFWVNPEKEVELTAPAVTANADYKHTAWKYNVNSQDKTTSGDNATKTVKDTFAADTDITAQYKKKVVDTEEPKKPGTQDPDPDYVKVDFKAETHGKIKDGEKKEFWVLKDETVEIKTPAVEPNDNYAFEKWDPAVQTSYSENKTHNAVFVYTGDDVVPQPGNDKPDVPDNFVEVVFEQGTNGTIANTETVTYWVNPAKEVTVTAPTVTANEGYKHVAWTYGTKEETNLQSVTDNFTEKKTTITAKYLKKVLEEEPQTDKDAYVKVTFKAETNGKLPEGKAEKSYWVLKDTPVSLTAPTVTANAGWKFIKYEPAVKTSYSEDTDHKAQYKKIIVTEDPKDKDYVKVTFDPAGQGTIKTGSNAEVWVLKNETIDPKDITPELEVKEKYAFEKWNPAVQKSYSTDTKHTAIYKYNGDDVVPQKPGEDKPNVPDNFVKVTFVAGDYGSIANTETYIYWVNPEKQVTLNAPTVTASEDWKHVAWTYKLKATDTDEKTTSGNNALTTVVDTFTEKETIITAKYLEKVVTENPNDTENYVKVTFKAEANGKLDGNKTETSVWVLKNTDVKVTAPTVTPNKGYTFTEWSPAVKTQYDTDTTHTAQYKQKDKVVTEDPNDPDYIKVTFNANGGKIGTEATKDVWVLNGIATFADAKAKVATPTKDKATFKEWQDKASEGTKVEDTKVLKTADETFYAAYTDKDKIIEDPTTPTPDPGYVRLTFDATEDGKIGKNQEKYIDVLEGTKYEDTDLQEVVKKIKPTYKDNTKVFENWEPTFPNTTDNVATSKYTAQYKDAEKIIDKDPTNPGNVDDKYIRFVFDANSKDDPAITGKINNNQKAIFDVLKGTKFNDPELQAKIAGIKAIPTDQNKVFKAWDPSVLKNDTLVENATTNDGMSSDKTTITYNASYKDKDADIVPGDKDKPDGYVTVRFLTNKNGTLTGTVTYYVNPKAGKKMSDITAPTIKANDGYKVATPNWKPDFRNDSSEIKEDRNYVANYDSENPSPTTFEINYISIDTAMGTVNPASETVNITGGTIAGSTATANDGYEFVKWIDDDGKEITEGITTTAQGTKLVPTARKSATYIAVFKEKVKETTADKVKKLYDFEGVDLAAFVGDKLTNEFWKDGVKKAEKAGSTLTDDEKAAINTALSKATVTDLSERNTDHEVLSPSKGRLQVKFKDNSTIIVEQKLYVYGNGSDKPQDPTKPTPKDEVDVTYKAGEGVVSFTDKVVMVKKGTKESDLPGKPDAKAQDGFKDLKWTADPAIDATYGVQANTTLTASAVVDHDFTKTSFTVKKVWPNDVNDVPTMNFTLYRKVEDGTEEKVDGAEVKTITKDLTAATWENLAKTNSEGKAYTYSVKESFAEKDPKNDNWILGEMVTDDEGNNTITNKLKTVPGTGENPEDDKNFVGKLTITKKLENEPVVQAQTNGMRRAPKQALKFSFKVTGPYGYEETFELTANESMTLENLAYGDYKVEETDSKGYTPEYSKAKETLTKDSPNGSITVTNKNKESTDPQKPNENIIDVTVKKVWSGVPQGTTTPSVTIELWRKGYDLSNNEYEQKVDEFTTAADNTAAEETKKFEKLAKQDPSGRDFTYYAVEANVPANYTATYSNDNLTITNTYIAPEKEYTVTYAKGADAAIGTMNPVTVTENTNHTVLANVFTNDGYTFTGWKVGETTEIKQPGQTITVTADVTLIAQWEKETVTPEPTEFTIKYISMDTTKGTVSPESETVEITGGTITGSTASANESYKFVKWMDTEGNQVSTNPTFVPTTRESATYIAVFEKEEVTPEPQPEPTYFEIKYISADTNQGTVSPESETVETEGGRITGSTAFARTGYRFVKWLGTDGFTKSKDERFVPTLRESATYIAVFEKIGSVTPPEPWPPTPGPGPEPDPRPWPPYRPHRPDPRPDDRYDRDDRDDTTITKPEDTRPVLDHEAYMFGYTDSTVRPNGNITRAEAAALVTRLLGIEAYASAAKPNFPDTPSAWYNKAINAAVERGIMKGYPDGRFRPNAPITRAEFTQMISTIDNKPYGVAPFVDVVGHWAERPIGSEYQAGRITGYPDGLFRPNAYITRCEAVVILNKIFERNYDEMSAINAMNKEKIKVFIDLTTSFWGYNDMVEATNSHSFKRRVEGRIEEDWVLVK